MEVGFGLFYVHRLGGKTFGCPTVPEPVVTQRFSSCLDSELGYWPLGDSQALHE